MSENTTNINNRLTVGRATVEPATMSNGNVLFSLQPYIEKEHIPDHAFLVHQNQPTIETLDDINAPYAKVLKFTGYNNECTLGEKIAVSAGERIYVEAWYMVPAADTGTAGLNYLGVRRYDKDNKPIAVNDGRNYVVSGLTLTVDGNWYKMSGYYTVESSHTPYNGSDGGAVRYLDLTFRLNFSTGTQEIYISGLTIKKVNASYDEGDTAFKGDVGIGTDNPDSKLHIVGSGNTSGTNALLVENSDGVDIMRLEDGKNTYLYGTTYHDETVYVNNQKNLFIRSLGNTEYTRMIQVGGELRFYQDNSGADSLNFRFFESGKLTLSQYTSTNFDGTPTSFLGVDGSGNVIKSSSVLTSTPTLQEVTDAGNSTTNDIQTGNNHYFVSNKNYLQVDQDTGLVMRLFLNESQRGELRRIGTTGAKFSIPQYSSGATAATHPTFANFNDQDSGMFFPADNSVGFSTNGIEALRVDSSGNIGINKTSPSAKLHIVGGAAAGGGTALLVENGAGDDLLKVDDNSDTTVFGEFKLAGYTSTFYDDTPNKFLGVDSSGNVVKQSRTWHSGIATTTTDANGEFILGSIPSSANAVTCCQYDSAGTATVYIFVYRGKNGSNQHFFKVYDLSGNAVTSTSIGVSFTYTMYPV